MKISEKDIARICDVSHFTVSRAIDNSFEYFKPNYHYLPKHLLFDEFKSTKDAKGSMSFIFANADNNEIVDIVENRQLSFLKRYFYRYSKSARRSVKTICIDMYSPYISLIKECFPNAKIIIDKFHIIQLLSRALNKTRINAMNQFPTYSMEYKRLKRYWKLLLTDQSKLDGIHFHYAVHFKNYVSNKTIVYESISVDSVLQNTYEAYQVFLRDINTKDIDSFKYDLNYFLNSNISEPMKISIRSILKNFEYIENMFKFNYSNGAIEGINNYIKTLKRIAFGYKSFFHFRNRILISKNLIKPKKCKVV